MLVGQTAGVGTEVCWSVKWLWWEGRGMLGSQIAGIGKEVC